MKSPPQKELSTHCPYCNYTCIILLTFYFIFKTLLKYFLSSPAHEEPTTEQVGDQAGGELHLGDARLVAAWARHLHRAVPKGTDGGWGQNGTVHSERKVPSVSLHSVSVA